MPEEWQGPQPVATPGPFAQKGSGKPAHRQLLAVAALAALAALGVPRGVVAQRAAQAQISVAATIAGVPASLIALPIKIGPPEAVPSNGFVRMRGLPPAVSLTEGHAIAPGSWAVPLFALSGLKANIPAGASGRTDFVISLLSADGAVLAEARSALVIATPVAAPAEKASADPRLVSPPAPIPAVRPQAAPRAPDLPPHEKARAERLLAKGEEYFASGNIAAARDFFERAADIGLATAALRLAATYDPAELVRAEAKGIVADRTLARKWYERARELGAAEAVERLARLNGS